MDDRELDALVAEKVLRLKVVTATDKHSMTWNGCRVSSGVYLDTGKKSAWGRVVKFIPHYSTSIADAFLVVEEMRRRGYVFHLSVDEQPHTKVLAAFGIVDREDSCAWTKSGFCPDNITCPSEDSVPHCIAIAALRALGVEVQP